MKRRALKPLDPKARRYPDGDASCVKCGCRQAKKHPFVHNARCSTIQSRPTVNAKYAAELFRSMWGAK